MRFLPLFAAIFAITPLAVDMYLPALVQIADDFQAPIQTLQNSISIFLAGYALGMFLFGPMADRFGRRPLLLMGLTGFVSCSVLLAMTQSAETFLVLRFFQAFFGGAATVVIPGAIRMIFGKDTAKGLSYVSMIMMVAPMLAPAIGGYLLLLDTWPLIFKVIAGYAGFILVVASIFFPNLEVQQQTPTQTINFIGRYKIVLGEAACRPLLMVTMMTSVVFFTYITSVSFLYIQVFGFNEQTFSWLFAANVIGMMGASFINTRIVPSWGSKKILRRVAPIGGCAALSVMLSMFSHAAPGLIIASIILMIATLMIISANADALILQQFGQHAGTATAVIGTLRFGCGALAGPLLALVFDPQGYSIGIIYVTCLAFIVIGIWRSQRVS
ncbi:multidrug effflux MFS transporter [Aliikangiella marina]|uniref:Bcr/CflA family efflux transporter n=1 Tax=Aliikangiella marina TaxID=1712262 RepID=A0A545T4N1_9GAMM|nr:multidrug effflux MFS transporter [Aliikangiella marina]TQV72179.1 multidrug effflux MFS transporter [Aliikangiella marina]